MTSIIPDMQWIHIAFVVFFVSGLVVITLLRGAGLPDGMLGVLGFGILAMVFGVVFGMLSGYSLTHIVLFHYAGPLARVYVVGVALAVTAVIIIVLKLVRRGA